MAQQDRDLAAFDAQMAEERKLFEASFARRRAEFVQQLVAQRKFEAAQAGRTQEPPAPSAQQQQQQQQHRHESTESCGVAGTPQQGKADKCAGCDQQSACASKPAAQAPPAPAQSPSAGCTVYGTENAGKADKCAGCSKKGTCSSGGAAGPDPTAEEIAKRMASVEHKILVLSGKGGVGKSMVSAQLAYALAARGFIVGLLDIDICGPTVPKMMGKRREGVMRGPEGLAPVEVTDRLTAMSIGFLVEDENEAVIWRGPRKIGLIQTFLKDVAWGVLDFLIVDTPPGTSDEHLSTVQLLKATGIDGAVVVTSPQDVSVVEVGKEINFCERMGVKVLGVVENFADFCCPLCSGVTTIWPSTSGGGRMLAEKHNVPFLGSVPLDPKLARQGDAGEAMDESSAAGKVIYSVADHVATSVNAFTGPI